jgi:MoxR-like ATPase
MQQDELLLKDSKLVTGVLEEMGQVIVGQRDMTRSLLIGLLTGGHVLLEGLPGLAKTLAVKTLSKVLDAKFQRIQFTPDLLPSDLIGTMIYREQTGEFVPKKGPIFANIVLADEINRAPAKVQSALLEAMAERQVTIGEQTFALEEPFLVLATQNPIEQEGTYPLPEAQVDRFLFKVKVGYGTPAEEQEIIARSVAESVTKVEKVIGEGEIVHMQQLAAKVHVAEKVRRYIVDLVFATRKLDGESPSRRLADLAPLIEVGASPRASINLEKAARVNALMQGRSFVTPQDVKDVGLDVMRHRIMPTYEAEAENISSDEIVRRVFERVDVP